MQNTVPSDTVNTAAAMLLKCPVLTGYSENKLQKLWYLLLNQDFFSVLNSSTLFAVNEAGFDFPGTEGRKSIMERDGRVFRSG